MFFLVLIVVSITILWNKIGPVQLPEVDKGYKVDISEGILAGKTLDPEAAVIIKDWVGNSNRLQTLNSCLMRSNHADPPYRKRAPFECPLCIS